MSLLTIALVIIVVGVLLWAAEKYIPMNDTVKRILIGVVVIVLILWILDAFGLLDAVRGAHIGTGRHR
jgi:hypothetical protein